jgi:hypothetical protein
VYHGNRYGDIRVVYDDDTAPSESDEDVDTVVMNVNDDPPGENKNPANKSEEKPRDDPKDVTEVALGKVDPKTGDNSPLALAASLLVGAGAATIGVARKNYLNK